MFRSWFAALVFAAFAFGAQLGVAPALAKKSPPPAAPPSYDEEGRAAVPRQRAAGSINGRVVAIDYRSGMMTVDAPRGRFDVIVLPSTNIQGPNGGFRTIADVVRGAKVHVLMSQRGNEFIAQIITLK